MTDKTESVAEETKAGSQNAAEASGAQEDDLDTLLNDFKEEKVEVKSEPESGDDIKALREKVESLERSEQHKSFRTDMDAAIASVRGDMDPDFLDNDLVEGWLNARANKDPRVALAFSNRGKNPSAYQKVLTGLSREFQGKFSNAPDRNITEDREAVASAVRGASKSTSETDDIDRDEVLRLSPHKFEAWVKAQSGKSKR